MSANNIGVGDLVVIVRWPCCGYRLGTMFVVASIHHGLSFHCNHCGATEAGVQTIAWNGISRGAAARFSWLKKLDAPAESIERDEVTHA